MSKEGRILSYSILFCTVIVAGLFPLCLPFFVAEENFLVVCALVAFNLGAWMLVVAWTVKFKELQKMIKGFLQDGSYKKVDLQDPFKNFGQVLRTLGNKERLIRYQMICSEDRQNNALLMNVNNLMSLAREVLPLSSIDFAFVDRESGVYHGSMIQGTPFRNDLETAIREGTQVTPDSSTVRMAEGGQSVLVLPIEIARVKAAVCRVKYTLHKLPIESDYQILDILAMQFARAMVEAQFTTELIRLREQTDKTVKTKTGFLAQLSHEVRGPLGIMTNAVELLIEGLCGDVTGEQFEMLKMIRANGEHLLELLNDVLDFAKVEAGKMAPRTEVFDVHELVVDVSKVVRAQAELKKQKIIVEDLEGSKCYVACDRRHFRQMLINLLTNACKYSSENTTVTVSVTLQNDIVRVSVTDQGVGISVADKQKVFAAFERIDNPSTRKEKGTGIGMSLTRQLANLNNGEVDFVSELGKGSSFWIDLPASEPANQLASKSENISLANNREVDGEGRQVLLIDSNQAELDVLTKFLSHRNFSVVSSSNLEEAHTNESLKNCDVIVVDETVLRGHMDPFILFNDLRRSSQKWIPIVLMSGEAFHTDIETFLKAGADLCVIKPMSLNEFGVACKNVSTAPKSLFS
jgi:signal transduction histidine kinase/CheY-like chemotaxis protein